MAFKFTAMNKNLQRKLSAYAATTAGAVALAGSADAQIIYTDVNPDAVVSDTVYYDLDMDGDAVVDFVFATEGYTTSYGPVNLSMLYVPVAANAVLGSLYMGSYPLPFVMNNGDSISSTNTSWNDGSVNGGLQYLSVLTPYGGYGNWQGQTDKYVGVRFNIGSNTHYGWVRLSVSANADTIIIKDYAYNSQPNIGLLAGETGPLNVAPVNSDPVNIYAADHTVFLQNAGAATGGNVRVYNINGQTVRESAITEENFNISLEGETSGIYFVEVLRPDGTRIVRKVYVQ